MAKTYDIPRPFHAIEGEHGTWTVQAYTPNNTQQQWVLVECSADRSSALSKADLLNRCVQEA